jgi:copper chaperone
MDMTQTITVEGMTCEHCEQTVEEALEEVEGISSATADRDSESATVEGSAEQDKLVAVVEDAGYDASM